MRLNKQNWKEVRFEEIADHIETTERDEEIRKTANYVAVEHLETLDLRVRGKAKEEQPTFSRKFKKGQILFAKRNLYLRKVAIAPFDGLCSPHLWAIESKGQLRNELLAFIMQTNTFNEYVNSNAAGTMSKYLKWPALSQFKFKLPSKDEQKKILDLFLTLEEQINNAEKQINLLKNFLTKLRNNLVHKDAEFGSLLDFQSCKKVTLGDVAYEIRENTKTPLEEGIDKFIGLENIEPGNLKVQGFGLVKDGTTFTKKFQIGDVLFGRRRAYLKKTAHADLEGLCSGDITVLRSIKELMLPDLLPHYMSADNIFDFAVQISAGSLSPRTKWKDLSKYELLLPDLDSQRKILDIFNSIVENINQNKDQRETLKKLKYKLLDEIFD